MKSCTASTICSPGYVNTFMADFEYKYIYPLIKEKPIFFLRYVDYICMVQTKSEKHREDFISELNQN